MKQILMILLIVPSILFAQQTYVPDDNFEQALIDLGYDAVLDDSVLTSTITSVEVLTLIAKNIYNLTGIEDFTGLKLLSVNLNYLSELDVSQNILLEALSCHHNSISTIDLSTNTALNNLTIHNNNLTDLDVSNNPNLVVVQCEENNLASLNLANGQNSIASGLYATGNSNLTCITVDDVDWATLNCINIDPQHYFSTDCEAVGIDEVELQNRTLLKITDILGRQRTPEVKGEILLYIYDNGTVDKKLFID